MFARFKNKILKLRKNDNNSDSPIDSFTRRDGKALPNDTVSLKETVINVPDPSVVMHAAVRRSVSQPNIISTSHESPVKSKKSTTNDLVFAAVSELEKCLNKKYFFGQFNILTLLQFSSIINFLLDIFGACFCYYAPHIDDKLAYLYLFSAFVTLIYLFKIINAIQEEDLKVLQHSAFWGLFKFVGYSVMYLMSYLIESIHFYVDRIVYPEKVFMIFFVPVCLACHILQHTTLTGGSIAFIELRNDFYVIPSARRSVKLRASAREYLAAQKSKNQEKF